MFKNSKSRIDGISDGIFAVVLTIMVLDIKIPTVLTSRSILQVYSQIFIYLVSVAIVAQYWFFHQEMFSNIKHFNNKVVIVNICLLATVSLIPFATSWYEEHLLSRVTVITFAAILLIANLFQHILITTILDINIDEGNETQHDIEERRSSLIMLIGSVVYLVIGGIFPVTFLALVLISIMIRLGSAFISRKLWGQSK